MADLILGPPIESRGGKGARPYANIGIGLIRSQTNTSGPANANNFGWNAAGGVMGYFSSHVGIRGDLRYFHTVNNTTVANAILLSPGSFHFWRAYVGLILR
jgi:opacity protein-like surface antigen